MPQATPKALNSAANVVDVVIDAGIMTITLNRPEARNAINGAVARGLRAALDRLDADPALRVAVLTGAGGNFSAGMDLKALADGEDVMNEVVIPGAGFGGIAEAPPAKPIIAAVEGYAVAGGFELALACDLIVTSSEARFGVPEVTRGLVAGGGALLRMPRQMPYRLAMELALTGRLVEAETLAQVGMVNLVVSPGSALDAARELAEKIASNAPLAVRVSKQVIVESADWPEKEMFDRQVPLMAPVLASEDVAEGARAFAEKRRPVWRGR